MGVSLCNSKIYSQVPAKGNNILDSGCSFLYIRLMPDDLPANEVLVAILEMVRDLHVYSRRQHGWIMALADAIAKDPVLGERLQGHPFYDQGPDPSLRSIDVMLQNIDALIQQLKRK